MPRDLPRLALIALGSNLGDSSALIARAVARLSTFSDHPIRRSSLWKSSPVDCPPGSPDFLNAAVALCPATEETPESLLKKLQALEVEFGRRAKTILNEPRPLDLDLIAFGSEMRHTPELMLPHPRAHLRRFVLLPLCEVAPDFVLPGRNVTVEEELAGLKNSEIVSRLGPL